MSLVILPMCQARLMVPRRLEGTKIAYGSHTTGGTRAREDCANLSISVNKDESRRVIINSLLKLVLFISLGIVLPGVFGTLSKEVPLLMNTSPRHCSAPFLWSPRRDTFPWAPRHHSTRLPPETSAPLRPRHPCRFLLIISDQIPTYEPRLFGSDLIYI